MKKPAQVVLSAEGYLRNDPRNRGMNKALADALEQAGYLSSSVVVWEFLGDDDRLGDYALKRAGSLYYGMKQLTKALGCYEAVLKRSPRDSEAEKMRKNLAAEGVLSSGSYDPSRSSRDLARDVEKKQLLEVEQKLVTTEDERSLLRKKMEQELEADPADRRARRNLVEHFVKDRDYAGALVALEAGLQLDPESYELKERIGDVKILDYEQQIRDARSAATAGDPAAQTDLVDLAREKQEFEIEEFTRRVKEHPTDLDLRFRLGNLMLASGKVSTAIENFQHSVKDPRRRIESLIGLGRAFEANEMLDLARKQYENALESVDTSSDRVVEINYSLAVLLEKIGDLAQARARFESIFEKDIHYRDVAERLEALREKARAPEPPANAKLAQDDSPDQGGATSTYGFKD
ncbi:MAG: tetratricopeptide repeat protein [Planctomycetota bacterium]